MKFILGLFFGAILTIGYIEGKEIYFIYKMESAVDRGVEHSEAIILAVKDSLPELEFFLYRCFIGGYETSTLKCKIARKTFTFITDINRPYWIEWNNK